LGGLGNQLFCYAAARRLALVNNAELAIDDVTGFTRDNRYARQYMLDHFHIPVRKATPAERLEPLERYRRGIMKKLARKKPFGERSYLEQEGRDFDKRLLTLKPKGTIYLDGLWQSENYFKDIEQTIREDLQIIPPTDSLNQGMAEKICNSQAVALHVRWFDTSASETTRNLSAEYYQAAITLIEERIETAHYFIFSDDPKAARSMISLPQEQITVVSHNQSNENAYSDLWLMVLCRYFITANSTFSWWGAWLSNHAEKMVVTPNPDKFCKLSAWGFEGLIPDSWIKL
jgi:hypothetical protein